LSPAPSPPPPFASSVAQRNSRSPSRGQRSPQNRSKSPPKAAPTSTGGGKSPKQKLQQRHSVGVAEHMPTAAATPSCSPSRHGNPPASAKVGRGANNQQPSSSVSGAVGGSTTSVQQPGKKAKGGIPSRPPAPPGAALRQNLPPKASPAPAPPSHHAHPKATVASPRMGAAHLPNTPKDVVKGQQHVGASAFEAQVKKKVEPEPGVSPSVKPKRHAPPPPAGALPRQSPHSSPLQARAVGKETPPPNYAEVIKQTAKIAAAAGGGGGAKSLASEKGGAREVGGSVPPKPPKNRRQISIDTTVPVPVERQVNYELVIEQIHGGEGLNQKLTLQMLSKTA